MKSTAPAQLEALDPIQLAVMWAGLDPQSPDSSHRAECEPLTLSIDQADGLLAWCARERLTGLLAHAIDLGSIVVSVRADSDLVRERVADLHEAGLRTSLVAEAAAVQAVTLLREGGVEAYVFKGAANAHLDYADPSMRIFHDADLHVPRIDFGRAIETLVAAGFEWTTTVMPWWWERSYARAAELRSPDGAEVDLHAMLATGYFGAVLDSDELRRDPDAIELAGTSVRTFNRSARALVSAYAIVLSRGPRLRLVRDLFGQSDLGQLDESARRLAGRDGVAVLERAEQAGRSLLLGDEAVVDCEPRSRRVRAALSLSERARVVGWRADAVSQMAALGWGDRGRFATGLGVGRLRRVRSHRSAGRVAG